MKYLIALVACAALPALAALATNPDVTPATIKKTICVAGYTQTVRPPVSYTNAVKKKLMTAAGLPWSRSSEWELDHLVPLTAGGHPRSPDNLRLQAWEPGPIKGWKGDTEAKVKDKLEVHLNRLVCSGAMPLAAAQQCIYSDWRACAKRLSVP